MNKNVRLRLFQIIWNKKNKNILLPLSNRILYNIEQKNNGISSNEG